MWHLEEPSQEILDWFKNLFLDDMCNSIRINLCKDVLDVLLPNDSQEIIETLMIESPATLYAHNNELEDDLKAKGLWTAENKDKLFKAVRYVTVPSNICTNSSTELIFIHTLMLQKPISASDIFHYPTTIGT